MKVGDPAIRIRPVTLADGPLIEEYASDPRIAAVGQRIRLIDSDEGQDRFEARVEIDARGQTFSAAQGLLVLGRKENPMTTEQVHAKAIELMLAQPSMIKRPVLVQGDRLLVGFKPDAYARLAGPPPEPGAVVRDEKPDHAHRPQATRHRPWPVRALSP